MKYSVVTVADGCCVAQHRVCMCGSERERENTRWGGVEAPEDNTGNFRKVGKAEDGMKVT